MTQSVQRRSVQHNAADTLLYIVVIIIFNYQLLIANYQLKGYLHTKIIETGLGRVADAGLHDLPVL